MKVLALAAALAGLAACAHVPTAPVGELLDAERPRAVRNEVAFIPQDPRLCGPTVLKMTVDPLRPGIPFAVYKSMSFREREQGTSKSDMTAAVRRLGLAPYRVTEARGLLRASADGRPVIVFQNLGLSWWSAWHFALLVGYDAGKDAVLLHSGTTPYLETPFREFDRTWSGGGSWALIATEPSDIPAEAPFDEAMDNAMVFEGLGQDRAAEALYGAMASRWPARFEPHLGLTNLFYRQGRTEDALREALAAREKAPTQPALSFNLAWLYHQTGQPVLAARLKEETLSRVPPEERQKYLDRLSF